MYPKIVIVRAKAAYDVCVLCCDDIETFITTPIERSYETDDKLDSVE